MTRLAVMGGDGIGAEITSTCCVPPTPARVGSGSSRRDRPGRNWRPATDLYGAARAAAPAADGGHAGPVCNLARQDLPNLALLIASGTMLLDWIGERSPYDWLMQGARQALECIHRGSRLTPGPGLGVE